MPAKDGLTILERNLALKNVKITGKPVKEIMQKTVDVVRQVGMSWFQGTDLGETQELMDTTAEEVTEDDLMEMSACEQVPDDEEGDTEAAPENKDYTAWQKGSDYSRLLLTFFMMWTLL